MPPNSYDYLKRAFKCAFKPIANQFKVSITTTINAKIIKNAYRQVSI